ncbi:MAG: maleylpyruvate isomerase N-terminal domain-containing protein, partial [Phycicoccus sp.]
LVHSDDLAASIGVEPPEFPRECADAVLALLASVAARRHGVTAVLRTLSRPQRQPRTVTAF